MELSCARAEGRRRRSPLTNRVRTRVAGKYGEAWVENELRKANESANPLLYRIAFKMATGTGKTVVMAMLIAWQALNKFAAPPGQALLGPVSDRHPGHHYQGPATRASSE